MRRAVVITGLGAVSGMGVGAGPLWDGLCAGRCCLGPVTRFDASGFLSRLAGEVKDFSAKDFVPKHYRKAVKVMARDIELAVGAAHAAVKDAGLLTRATLDDEEGAPTYPSERTGCQIGAGLIAAESDELAAAFSTAADESGRFSLERWGRTGMDNLTPLWMLKYLPNMLACHVTILHGAEGPSNTITCAEASGLLSIGESMRVIQRGAADLCFSGSAESKVNHMGTLRMELAGRLAPTGDATDGLPFARPFDSGAAGGILGEGGGIVMLEAAQTADARGARVHAVLSGFGAAQSFPDYAPDDAPDEDSYADAIEAALADAGVRPDHVDAVVPLALGVAGLDAAEARGLRRVFGDRLASLPLVTTTPAIGNLVAGMGGVQAVVGAMCISAQRLPARLHGGRPEAGLLAGTAPSTPAQLRHVVVCSPSQGGHNAAVVISRPDAVPATIQ
jgi:3-oxoacyl-[acyl-carrier-protein] synthase II